MWAGVQLFGSNAGGRPEDATGWRPSLSGSFVTGVLVAFQDFPPQRCSGPPAPARPRHAARWGCATAGAHWRRAIHLAPVPRITPRGLIRTNVPAIPERGPLGLRAACCLTPSDAVADRSVGAAWLQFQPGSDGEMAQRRDGHCSGRNVKSLLVAC